jgi:hypothetical protein
MAFKSFCAAKLSIVRNPNKKSVKDLHSFLLWCFFEPILHRESVSAVGALRLIIDFMNGY